MNLAWRLWAHPNILLTKAFRGKYYPNTNFWSFPSKATDSATCKFMVRAREHIKKYAMWVIANGHKVGFWDDKCSGHQPLNKIFIGPLHRGCADWKVSDFVITHPLSWDMVN